MKKLIAAIAVFSFIAIQTTTAQEAKPASETQSATTISAAPAADNNAAMKSDKHDGKCDMSKKECKKECKKHGKAMKGKDCCAGKAEASSAKPHCAEMEKSEGKKGGCCANKKAEAKPEDSSK
ncbi:MAG: hypothetical protein JSS90_08280 [Bacteroidetes bacterium]|nr:hypothetical protein [Bacteroidota bacterium]